MKRRKALLIRVDQDVANELNRCASRYGRRSGNEVAAEIIDLYFDFWKEAEDGKIAVIERQRTIVKRKLERAASDKSKTPA